MMEYAFGACLRHWADGFNWGGTWRWTFVGTEVPRAKSDRGLPSPLAELASLEGYGILPRLCMTWVISESTWIFSPKWRRSAIPRWTWMVSARWTKSGAS